MKQMPMMIPEVDTALLYSTTDAMVWAQEFVKVLKMRPDLAYDEGFVVAWFANAMETVKTRAEMERGGGCIVETI